MHESMSEPVESQLPDKPAVPEVEEDTSYPGELPVPEEEYMDPEAAVNDERVDDAEAAEAAEAESGAEEGGAEGDPNDAPRYDGGEIPAVPSAEPPEVNPAAEPEDAPPAPAEPESA